MSKYEWLLSQAYQQLENAKAASKLGHRAYAVRCLVRAGEYRRKAARMYYKF